MPQRLRREDYTVGWVCALSIELAAAKALLDERHEAPIDDIEDDGNVYCTGSMAGHNVVIVCLPAGRIGNNPAATVATQMQASFKGIRFGLMVGIGGGVPSPKADIRLGDVVVSEPYRTFGGVVQYDKGKTTTGGFERTGSLNSPPQILLSAIQTVKANHDICESRLLEYVSKLERLPIFRRQRAGPDVLFKATYDHGDADSCENCDPNEQEDRAKRLDGELIEVHYGTIASGNRVIKRAIKRDKASHSLGGVLCFEMEAAGLMDTFPCLVIRGICDYADSHKNKKWQPYAAGTAASYAKEMLSAIPTAKAKRMYTADDIMRDAPSETGESFSSKRRKTETNRSLQDFMEQDNDALVASHLNQESVDEGRKEQKRDLLQSLMFDKIDSREMNIGNAHAKTCRWLLEKSEYLEWLDPEKSRDHNGFLWIKGKPGAGKSTLIKYALTHARKTMDGWIIISFFFHGRGESLEKSTIGAYRSLLIQLFQRRPASQELLLSLGVTAVTAGAKHQWTIEALEALLEDVILNVGKSPIILFIDALDECEEQHEIRNMVSFFQRIGGLAMSAGIRLRICFASRLYPHITINKGLHLILHDHDEHRQDIASYLESELRIGNSNTAQEVRSHIQEKASGIFMWVVLVTRILNTEYDQGRMHALRQRLRVIPQDLHTLFLDMLSRDMDSRTELLLCIQWTLFAKQSLSPEQLYFAIFAGIDLSETSAWDREEMAMEDIERFLLNNSKGLIKITRSEFHHVQFIHESVRDFFLEANGLGHIWPELKENLEGQSHEKLKQCCLNYLTVSISAVRQYCESMPDAAVSRNQIEARYPLLGYAVQRLISHADTAEAMGLSQTAFLNNFNLAEWISLHNLIEPTPTSKYSLNASLLYILAEHNLPHLIKNHESTTSCFKIENERCGCPLLAAMAAGNGEAIEAMLESFVISRSANIDPEALYSYITIENWGHRFIKTGFKFWKGGNVLSYLIEYDFEVAVVIFVQSREFDANCEDHKGDTPIFKAIAKKDEKLVKLLLNSGMIDVNRRRRSGDTPLSTALSKGYKEITRLLLEEDTIDINILDWRGRTPFMKAILDRDEELVKLLLRTGKVDFSVEDAAGDTPLFIAVAMGDEGILRLLLQTGRVDVNTKDHDGNTPLSIAVRQGLEGIARALVETRRADIQERDSYGRSLLSVAVFWGHEGVLRLLLDTGGIDVNAKDFVGETPLFVAATHGDEALVGLLLESGDVDINEKDNLGRGALSQAVALGHKKIVELLLDTGRANTNEADYFYGMTPLSVAVEKGYEGIVDLLESFAQLSL
ncbi:unnamed protein product [Periconia digitata]|uniref:Nucleoside phosphorylase domain-containing protein n=1 Tax=Periconia digitata TaxID=1303443 RepID=A0A9W4XJ03_9PLEO|nr:unnamed protein product [Periconia digitata]